MGVAGQVLYSVMVSMIVGISVTKTSAIVVGDVASNLCEHMKLHWWWLIIRMLPSHLLYLFAHLRWCGIIMQSYLVLLALLIFLMILKSISLHCSIEAKYQSTACKFEEPYLCGYRSAGAPQWSHVIGEEVQDGVGPNRDPTGALGGRSKRPGLRLNMKAAFPGILITIIKMRRQKDRVIFTLGIPIQKRRCL